MKKFLLRKDLFLPRHSASELALCYSATKKFTSIESEQLPSAFFPEDVVVDGIAGPGGRIGHLAGFGTSLCHVFEGHAHTFCRVIQINTDFVRALGVSLTRVVRPTVGAFVLSPEDRASHAVGGEEESSCDFHLS